MPDPIKVTDVIYNSVAVQPVGMKTYDDAVLVRQSQLVSEALERLFADPNNKELIEQLVDYRDNGTHRKESLSRLTIGVVSNGPYAESQVYRPNEANRDHYAIHLDVRTLESFVDVDNERGLDDHLKDLLQNVVEKHQRYQSHGNTTFLEDVFGKELLNEASRLFEGTFGGSKEAEDVEKIIAQDGLSSAVEAQSVVPLDVFTDLNNNALFDLDISHIGGGNSGVDTREQTVVRGIS